MAEARRELIKMQIGDVDTGYSWEAPVFEFETDDETIEVLGWDGMNEDPDNMEMPWQILTALTLEGEMKYIAVPNGTIEYLGLKTEVIGGDSMSDEDREKLYESMTEEQLTELNERVEAEQRRVWLNFINYGENWADNACEAPAPLNIAEKKTDFNLRDRIMKIWKGSDTSTVKIGKHCLQLADKIIDGKHFFGDGPEWAIGSVLQPYREFLEGVVETIKKNTDCYIDDRTGAFYPVSAFTDNAVTPNYRVQISGISIAEADMVRDWNKAADDDRKIPATLTHKVTGNVSVLKKGEDGRWTEAKSFYNVSLADIPAMNMGNGRFKKSGSIYSIVNKAFMSNTKLKTAGMTLQEGLEVGIYDFMKSLAVKIADSDFSRDETAASFFGKLNMNSGFTEIFLNAHGAEDDSGNELGDLMNELLEEESEEIEDNDNEKEEAELTEEERKEIKRKKEAAANKAKTKADIIRNALETRITKFRKHLKGSAMYDNENNPVPRAQMTVRFDEKMNDPNLLTTYMTDSSGSPEGKNAPKVGRMLSLIRVTLDGTVYKPCLTLEQLKDVENIKPEDIKWVRAFARKDDADDKEALENCYYIRAGLVNEDGTLKTKIVNGRKRITAQFGENFVEIDPYHATRPVYVSPDPRCDHVAGTELSGLAWLSKEVRTQIKTSNMKDATTRTETQSPSLFVDREAGIGEELITRAKGPGVVEEIKYGMTVEGRNEPVEMTVLYDDGNRETIDLRWQDKMNSKNGKRQQPCYGVEKGVRIAANQPLTDAPGISLGMATLGPPLVIVIASGPGEYGTDDSVYLSKRAAEAFGAPLMEKQTEEIVTNEAGSPYGPTFIFNPTIGQDSSIFKGRYDCSKLGDDGLVKAGEIVNTGDIIAFMAEPDGSKKRTVGEQLAMKRPVKGEVFTPPSDYKIVPLKARKGIVGMRTTAQIHDNVGKGRSSLEVSYFKEQPLTTGSKISFDGVKATVHVAEEGDGIFIHAPGYGNWESVKAEKETVNRYLEEFNKYGTFCENEIDKWIKDASTLSEEIKQEALSARGRGREMSNTEGGRVRIEAAAVIQQNKEAELGELRIKAEPESIFNGVEADVVMSEFSLQNRSTISFMVAGLLMRAAAELGCKLDVGVDTENVLIDTMNFLRKNGFGDGSVKIYGKIGVNVIPENDMQGGLLLVCNGMNVAKNVETIRGESAVTNSPMVQDSVLADGLFKANGAMISESPSRNGSITKTSEQAAMFRLGVGTAISTEDDRDHYNPGYTEKFFGRE